MELEVALGISRLPVTAPAMAAAMQLQVMGQVMHLLVLDTATATELKVTAMALVTHLPATHLVTVDTQVQGTTLVLVPATVAQGMEPATDHRSEISQQVVWVEISEVFQEAVWVEISEISQEAVWVEISEVSQEVVWVEQEVLEAELRATSPRQESMLVWDKCPGWAGDCRGLAVVFLDWEGEEEEA